MGYKLFPKCSQCRKRFFILFNPVGDIKSLKRFDEYLPFYDNYSSLCFNCWEKITTVPCPLCNNDFNVFEDMKKKLGDHLKYHGIVVKEISQAKHVCPECFKKYIHTKCSRCKNPFPSHKDHIKKYQNDSDIKKWLVPYHSDYSKEWTTLCPECYQKCLDSCKTVQLGLKTWVRSAESITNYDIVKVLGMVEYRGTSCSEPVEVEERLKVYSVQKGGNAYIKCHWSEQEQRNSKTVLAGYGKKGNPYYKTVHSTERWFTGYATAVLVEPVKKNNKVSLSLNKYSTNRDPVKLPSVTGINTVIVDGLNVCRWSVAYDKAPDLSVLITLCIELAIKNINFFCFFDANTRYCLKGMQNDNQENAYTDLINKLPAFFGEVPGRTRADEFILQKADTDKGFIISNDQFKEYHEQYNWLDEGSRLIKGMVADNRLSIPRLKIDASIYDEMPHALSTLMMLIGANQPIRCGT
ncbi:MAG: hypothetical protein QG588_2186 [Candidatus Poribacteria bacterium]|nr:hypothetical protein [Candidatus Poribacteria bacterium]